MYFMAAIIKSQEIKKAPRFGLFSFPSFDFRSTKLQNERETEILIGKYSQLSSDGTEIVSLKCSVLV